MDDLYADRKLSDGYPELEELASKRFTAALERRHDDTPRVERLLSFLGRLIDLQPPKDVLVVGCGPRPQIIKILLDKRYNVRGVEPVPSFVDTANKYLETSDAVLEGAAERLPQPDESQDLVLFESVFEHVDSPIKSLNEMNRVLRPGGVVLVTTTNRHRISLIGHNGEFEVRFYNWLPPLVKESYVHKHLHYDPRLSNYTARPAVHWFTYSELCALGRDAGFARFYSPLDLMRETDSSVRQRSRLKSRLRRWLIGASRRRPWVRALALTQLGDTIMMVKR